jgi:hypothetical protein
MDVNEKNIESFDNYISGKLSAFELIEFEQKLETDQEFSQEFYDYKRFISHLNQSIRESVKKDIRDAEKKYFKTIFWRKILFLSLSIISVACILVIVFFPKNKEIVKVEKAKPIDNQIVDKELIDSTVSEETTIENSSPTKPIEKTNLVEKTQKTAPILVEEKAFYQTNYSLSKFTETNVKMSNDTIFVQTAEKVNQIVPFEKDKSFYLLLNSYLYKSINNKLTKVIDNRPAELIGKSTGRGKKWVIVVEAYQTQTSSTKLGKNASESVEVYELDNQKINKETFEKISSKQRQLLERKTSYFTSEDVYNLFNN